MQWLVLGTRQGLQVSEVLAAPGVAVKSDVTSEN